MAMDHIMRHKGMAKVWNEIGPYCKRDSKGTGIAMDHIAKGEDIAKVWKKQGAYCKGTRYYKGMGWHRSILQGVKVLQRYGNGNGPYCKGRRYCKGKGKAMDHTARGEGIAKVWIKAMDHIARGKVLQRYGNGIEPCCKE